MAAWNMMRRTMATAIVEQRVVLFVRFDILYANKGPVAVCLISG
jgi:hypothetical protein